MRIECKSIDAFCNNIDLAKNVFQSQIFVDDHLVPLDGRDLNESFRLRMYIQASTVLQYPNGEEALLVASDDCGIVRRTADDDGAAQQDFNKLLKRLNDFAEKRGLTLVQGVLTD